MPSGLMGCVLIIVKLLFKLPVNCTFHTNSSWYNAFLCSLFRNDGSLGCSIPNTKGRVTKKANYPHFVDKRLTPPPYPHCPKLIIFTIRNFFIHIRGPPTLPLSTFIDIG